MKPRLAELAMTVAVAAATALFGAAVVGADPDQQNSYCPSAMMFYNPGYCDPHMPDPLHDHCAGGRMGSMMSDGYCDGEPYPDGSYWHVTQPGAPTVDNPSGWMSLTKACVVHDGPGTQSAPPGGCGGAA
ncbi:MAG TPA: hypothetical protein VFQ37_01835 [Mycobacterium sp.]|nr:hypothetical protein [Mycobacterium sp.]